MTRIAHAASAQRAPNRLASSGASGAKIPMHRTGIALSAPATPCEMPSPAWMLGSNGPMAMTCDPEDQRDREERDERPGQ